MQTVTFNAQLENTGHRIKALSGRLGPFIFRTYKDGKITAFYKPRITRLAGPSSGQCASNFEALCFQLREITTDLGLSIVSINYNDDL